MTESIEKGKIVLDCRGGRPAVVLEAAPDEVHLLVGIEDDGSPVTETRAVAEVAVDWVAFTNKPMMDNCDFGDRHAPPGAYATVRSNWSQDHAGQFVDGNGPFDLVLKPSGVWWCGQTFHDLAEDLVFFPSAEAALEAGHSVPSPKALNVAAKMRDLLYDHALANQVATSMPLVPNGQARGALVPKALLQEIAALAEEAGMADVAVAARLGWTAPETDSGADQALCTLEMLDWMASNSGLGESFRSSGDRSGFVKTATQAQLDAMEADSDHFEP